MEYLLHCTLFASSECSGNPPCMQLECCQCDMIIDYFHSRHFHYRWILFLTQRFFSQLLTYLKVQIASNSYHKLINDSLFTKCSRVVTACFNLSQILNLYYSITCIKGCQYSSRSLNGDSMIYPDGCLCDGSHITMLLTYHTLWNFSFWCCNTIYHALQVQSTWQMNCSLRCTPDVHFTT